MKTSTKTTIVGGLNPTRNVLLKAVKLTTGLCLTTPAVKYFKLYDKWTQCEGKRSALLRAKAIHHVVVNYVLQQPSPNYPFLSTTAGFPTAVIGLQKYCSSPAGIQATLSVTGHFRGMMAPGTPNLLPITEDGKEAPDGLINELVSQVPTKWKFDIDQLPTIHHEFRTRMGPNGQALTSSVLDLIALKEESKLMDHLQDYYDFFDSDVGEDLTELSELCKRTSKRALTPSRISVKKEYGGKDRLFAMCDYWTQIALHPLHDKLASILKDIREDATFGQDTATDAIKQWSKDSKEPLYSLDLTSATDRFPVKAITAMISNLTNNHDFGNSWRNLIADRQFSFLGQKVKWAVGQPLGAYSSWPSFALCHHLVVKLAAVRSGIKAPKYRILGDDIVISGKLLSENYITIMTSLGVQFSLAKTVSGLNRAEFAKRLFLHGNEITPLPIKLIQSSLSNYLLSKTLSETIQQRTSDRGSLPSILNLQSLYKGYQTQDKLKKIALLTSFPFKTGIRIKEDGPSTPWSRVTFPSDFVTVNVKRDVKDLPNFSIEISLEELGLLHFFIRYRYIRDGYARGINETSRYEKTLDTLDLPGIEPVDRPLHPVYKTLGILADAQAKAHRALGSFWTEAKKKGANAKVPNVNLPIAEVFLPKHKELDVMEAKVILHTYTALLKYGAWRKNNLDHKSTDAVIKYVQAANML